MAVVEYFNGKEHWMNTSGAWVAKERIDVPNQLKDELIVNICRQWAVQQEELKFLKSWIYKEVAAYLNQIYQKYGAKEKTVNVTLYDYSGQIKLVMSRAKLIGFDERLDIAKTLIEECIEEWSQGSNQKLVAVIRDSFRVDQTGKVSVPRILSLRKLEIEDNKWMRAMDAIQESILVHTTKDYVRLYKRDPEAEQAWIAMPLNIATL